MKKGCKSYKVNPKNSYISSKNFLVAKGAIDKYLNIIDLNGFRKEVVELTKLAKNKHNVDKGLLFGERTIYSANKPYFQAVPNKDAFSEINKVKTKAQSQEDLSDFYMGDEALREQEERNLEEDQNQELFLYLSKEMSDKLGYNNPGSTAAPSIKDIITRIPVINQTDIDNKKLEC
jgi:hypothetical protein